MNNKTILCIIIILILLDINTYPAEEEIFKWDDCVKAAILYNPELQSAEKKIAQAEAASLSSRSGMLPSVDATASIAEEKSRSSTGITTGWGKNISYGVTVKQLLFDGWKSVNSYRSYLKKLEQSSFDFNNTSVTVRYNLRIAFIELLHSQELISVKKEIVQIREQNYELVNRRYKSGIEHKGSLLTAEANLAQAKLELREADRNVYRARYGLLKQMGIKEYRPLAVVSNMEVSIEREKPDLQFIADKNPSLLSMIRKREAAAYDVQSAKGDYYPQIYGQVSADRSGSNLPGDQYDLSGAITMSFNLFKGFGTKYSIENLEAVYRQYEIDERNTRETLKLTLEQNWYDLQNNIDAAGVQLKILSAAEERAKIADAMYSIGSITFDNWIIIQNNRVDAKKQYLEARINALNSEAAWVQAKGQSLNYEEKKDK